MPCKLCPDRRFPPLDEISLETLEVNALAVNLTPEMGQPPLPFVFQLFGLKVPSSRAREVAERLAMLWRLQREHHTKQEERGARNGRHASAS